MRAMVYDQFNELPDIRNVPDPAPSDGGVVIRVEATGLCRSDWHGWKGHDPDIHLPHVPGHELAGTVLVAGSGVTDWRRGDRVTLPFVCGCGDCPQCASGNHQVCDHQFQPGFTHWGSFAEFVAIDRADVNLVRLPDEMDFVTAASLGCRFITAFRAVVDQANLSSDQWLAVHGCGGVGLSAIMIAAALGAHVVAIDIADARLNLARALGAEETINGEAVSDVAAHVMQITHGGAHVSIDALGNPTTLVNSVSCLRKRGTHMQIGLMLADNRLSAVPMDLVIAHELRILGTHGMQSHRYPALFKMIREGRLAPERLVGKTITLNEAPEALASMDRADGAGLTVIDRM